MDSRTKDEHVCVGIVSEGVHLFSLSPAHLGYPVFAIPEKNDFWKVRCNHIHTCLHKKRTVGTDCGQRTAETASVRNYLFNASIAMSKISFGFRHAARTRLASSMGTAISGPKKSLL